MIRKFDTWSFGIDWMTVVDVENEDVTNEDGSVRNEKIIILVR